MRFTHDQGSAPLGHATHRARRCADGWSLPAWSAPACASAADAVAGQDRRRHLPIAQVFTILFLMLGPFKIVGPFLEGHERCGRPDGPPGRVVGNGLLGGSRC